MFITLIGPNNGKFKVFVGDPFAAHKLLGGEPPVQSMQPVFDDIVEQLNALGFERKERMWYSPTANNALVQNFPKKIVWLPTYGYGAWKELEKTDTANGDVWVDLGEVRFLNDFHPFAENLGAVHCIKKYLARGN